jgi:hypothetical protein
MPTGLLELAGRHEHRRELQVHRSTFQGIQLVQEAHVQRRGAIRGVYFHAQGPCRLKVSAGAIIDFQRRFGNSEA